MDEEWCIVKGRCRYQEDIGLGLLFWKAINSNSKDGVHPCSFAMHIESSSINRVAWLASEEDIRYEAPQTAENQ